MFLVFEITDGKWLYIKSIPMSNSKGIKILTLLYASLTKTFSTFTIYFFLKFLRFVCYLRLFKYDSIKFKKSIT